MVLVYPVPKGYLPRWITNKLTKSKHPFRSKENHTTEKLCLRRGLEPITFRTVRNRKQLHNQSNYALP